MIVGYHFTREAYKFEECPDKQRLAAEYPGYSRQALDADRRVRWAQVSFRFVVGLVLLWVGMTESICYL